MQSKTRIPLIALSTLVHALSVHAQPLDILDSPGSSTFPLVGETTAADIVYDAQEAKVVDIAVHLLADDIERVTGKTPTAQTQATDGKNPLVLVGTIGNSRAITALAKSGKLDISQIDGKWESFIITTITDPFEGIDEALVIAGSDPRGTAFGIFTLSEAIGVSPWYFWADVPPKQHAQLHVARQTVVQGPPAVKYRGIFINDEDWGLEPWSSKTFEPEAGTIGPKTHEKIFELLLRLKANALWPAMHECTSPFFQVPGNADVADNYAIVVGTSHCEPMLRNNVREWELPKDQFNYLTHEDEVRSYWEERVQERTSGESIYTIGMRGIHDGAMAGPRNQKERIDALETIFEDQRELLAKHLGDGDPTRIAQIFVPYKEVLDDYAAGLEVPDDVTIVWPDDNFGYVRRFASPEEREREGGLGVYYHLSYLGNPLSWLWIDTQAPALVWSEMSRAYEQGARSLWIANVGDLKNKERSTEFFLDLAWNADQLDPTAPVRFLHEATARDFGPEFADEIVNILQRLQAINFDRKAEHLQWHYSLTPYQPTELNETEIHERLDACAELLKDSEAVANRLPPEMHNAYFELVGYPVAITAAANERYFRSELARADIARGRAPDVNQAAVKTAEQHITRLTVQYNEEIADGKWKNIVTENGVSSRDWRRFQPERDVRKPDPAPDNVCPPAPPALDPLPQPEGARSGDFVERNGVVSIHAGHFTDRNDLPSGAGWRSVPGLGRTGSAVTVLPSMASLSGANTPSLEYRFYVSNGGHATLHVRLLPTHPLVSEQGLRFAVALDNRSPIPLSATTGFDPSKDEWKFNIMANAREMSAELTDNLTPGWHTLRLDAVDAGVVVDKIVIDLGGLAPSYNGPDETRIP